MKLIDLKERIERALAIGGSRARDADVVILVHRPGSVGSSPCVDIEFAGMGVDWDADKFQLTADKPVSTLTREQLEELRLLATKGVTWGSYQHHKDTKARIAELESEVARSKNLLMGYIERAREFKIERASVACRLDTLWKALAHGDAAHRRAAAKQLLEITKEMESE